MLSPQKNSLLRSLGLPRSSFEPVFTKSQPRSVNIVFPHESFKFRYPIPPMVFVGDDLHQQNS
jgi:hypothetical protein